MVEDYRSPHFDTTNPYLKYEIIVNELSIDETNNTSTVNIKVIAWRTNDTYPDGTKIITRTSGTCYVKVDGDDSIGDQDWPENTEFYYESDTEIFDADIVIEHDSDGTKTVYIEAGCQWYKDSSVHWHSDPVYQGYNVELTKINRGPSFNVTISPVDITHNTADLMVSSARGGIKWWYALGDSTGTIFGDWVLIDESYGLSRSFTITDLQPNSTFTVKAKVIEPWMQEEAESAIYTFKTTNIPISDAVVRRITLFDDNTTDFSTNGIGSLLDAFTCVITEELNGQFELEMEYPISGKLFDYIDFRKIIMANPNQYTGPQPFRIYSISKPLNGRVKINAAHISYDLSDYTVSPFEANTLSTVFDKISNNSDVSCPFTFWTDMISDYGIKTTIPATIRSLLGGSDGTILSTYGGEYEYDMFAVKLWAQRGINRGVTIRYGKNLTSFKQDANNSNVYTAIRPYWYKEPTEDNPDEGGLVELPEKIITVGTYDYIKILIVDFTGQFVDEENKEYKPTVEQLRAAANEFIEYNDIGTPEVSLDVSFVQLSDSLEYKDIALLERVQLGDTVNILFPEMNVSATAKCIKTVFNVLSQRYNSINLGSAKQTLSGTISNNMKNSKEYVTKEELQRSIVYIKDSESSVENYVYLDYNTRPSRLLSLDKPTADNAKNIWKMDVDGISHSSTGVNGPYQSAIMQCGAIDSKFLLYGTIDGNIINPGTVAKGDIHSAYEQKINDTMDAAINRVKQMLKCSDNRTNNLSNQLYTDEVVVGNGKFVKVEDGIDFVLFNNESEE